MADREAVLGFKPQKECPYNRLLPYADKLDAESNEHLSELKTQLSRSIQLRDIKIGTSHWLGQLSRYVRIYGFKFSKEDHLNFIHLLFELMITPDLDFTLIQKLAQILTTLLKKEELLTRDDLELPWRPLHQLLKKVTFSNIEENGLVLFPENVDQVLKSLIRCSRIYFPASATQEMLDEWRPLMCPFDMTMVEAMYFLDLFLPTVLPPEQHHMGYKLWLEELLGIWNACQNTPSWETNLLHLFSRLAHDALGYIDWNPWIPKIFTRFLRCLNLPVGAGLIHVGRGGNSAHEASHAWFIVGMMGGPHTTLDHLEKLFKALESFYHPSNVGKWHSKLMKLMFKLPKVVVKRLHRERYQKSWLMTVPESHRLTDDEITRFVDIMQPVVELAMFSKFGSHDSSLAMQNLAVLRPDKIIPPLLEKTYPALETLTEPHRLIACMHCVVAVSRQMLSSHETYPEGRLHVIPLLNLSLPGIDPNDIKKSLVTFQLISTLVSLVPVRDCSEALSVRNDLTEVERELCGATSQFEDFVLLFMDRIFPMIENSNHDHTRSDASHGAEVKLTQEESMIEIGLLSTFNAIMQQSSEQIYHEALIRLHRFVITTVLEIKVAGRFVGDLIRAAVKINPAKALKLFVMHFCDTIKQRCAHEDISKEEHLDNEFMWSLKMLSEVVRCNARHVLLYKNELISVLQCTLHLRCIEAQNLSTNLLRHLLRSLTVTYANDYRSTQQDWNQPIKDHLPIRDWGASGNLNDLVMVWHVPSKQELDVAQEIINRFLGTELQSIRDHISGQKTMPREDLLQCLSIIHQCLSGVGSVMPPLENQTPLTIVESLVPQSRFPLAYGSEELQLTLNGKNIRLEIINTIRPLMVHMMSSSADDTKGFNKLINIYSTVIFFFGTVKEDFENRWKSLHMVKKSMENRLIGNKRHIRALLVDRVQLQHELRVQNCAAKHFTEIHRELFRDLLSLSVSRYSRVRMNAQRVLGHGFHIFAYSYRCFVDDLCMYLQQHEDTDHDQFKGALYVIIGVGRRSLMSKHSWEVMGKLWPKIICAHHSEKPSILGLMDKLMDRLHKNIETTQISIKVSNEAIAKAKSLAESQKSTLTPQEIEAGLQAETKRNEEWKEGYYELVNKLVSILEGNNLNWRFYEMGLVMLDLMIRPDVTYPPNAVRLFTNNMVHESIVVRKICTNAVSSILKIQKRRHATEPFDPYAEVGVSRPPAPAAICPGDREDNVWHHYDGTNAPKSALEAEKMTFVEKTHWGYYMWPKEMLKYSPEAQQPKLGRSFDELRDEEKPIFESFQNKDFVDKLIGFLSLEEEKGKDKFHSKYFTLFKGVFRNFDESALELLKPHVERLIADTSLDRHDSSQRCAAELIAGLVRGSKHWGYDRSERMWNWLLPIMTALLKNMTVETISDWGTCFATISESRDPRKLGRMFDLLMDDPLQGEDGGAFAASSRLYVLQGSLAQQEWRVPKLLNQLLDYMKPMLQHSYKNVRDRLGSVLVNIFLYDFELPNCTKTLSPQREPFITHILERLVILTKENDNCNHNNGEDNEDGEMVDEEREGVVDMIAESSGGDKDDDVAEADQVELKVLAGPLNGTNGVIDGESEERKAAVRLCKTTLKWLQGCFSRMFQCMSPQIFSFLPIVCLLESEKKDPELRQDCLVAKSCMAFMLLSPELIPHALDIIEKVSLMKSWHARAAILSYTQVMVFCNLFLMQEVDTRARICSLVLDRLCDEQLEVREMAGLTFGGLLHCGYFELNKETLDHFMKLSRTKVKKSKRKQKNETESASTSGSGSVLTPQQTLIRRHAGVLGLCACVTAFPYDVPEQIPEILMILSTHVDDPQPVQRTVKKALSNFKRTHHDNWHDHSTKFTDDQLAVMTDLLVSPNYYA